MSLSRETGIKENFLVRQVFFTTRFHAVLTERNDFVGYRKHWYFYTASHYCWYNYLREVFVMMVDQVFDLQVQCKCQSFQAPLYYIYHLPCIPTLAYKKHTIEAFLVVGSAIFQMNKSNMLRVCCTKIILNLPSQFNTLD